MNVEPIEVFHKYYENKYRVIFCTLLCFTGAPLKILSVSRKVNSVTFLM